MEALSEAASARAAGQLQLARRVYCHHPVLPSRRPLWMRARDCFPDMMKYPRLNRLLGYGLEVKGLHWKALQGWTKPMKEKQTSRVQVNCRYSHRTHQGRRFRFHRLAVPSRRPQIGESAWASAAAKVNVASEHGSRRKRLPRISY